MFYHYPPLISGRLIRRYKRFLADIELESGEIITAHCPNTGPMIGVCTPNSKVYVSQSDNPKRKYGYTWELIEVNDTQPTWVGINTALPNKLIKIALEKQIIPELSGQYTQIRPEVAYGENNKSRIDFLLKTEEDKPIYLEIKNTTLCEGKTALFPDTVTTRGQKHLLDLMALLPNAQPVMLYFINRSDCEQFSPSHNYDPIYGQLFHKALELGLKILPCRFQITPEGVDYLGLATLLTEQP